MLASIYDGYTTTMWHLRWREAPFLHEGSMAAAMVRSSPGTIIGPTELFVEVRGIP